MEDNTIKYQLHMQKPCTLYYYTGQLSISLSIYIMVTIPSLSLVAIVGNVANQSAGCTLIRQPFNSLDWPKTKTTIWWFLYKRSF